MQSERPKAIWRKLRGLLKHEDSAAARDLAKAGNFDERIGRAGEDLAAFDKNAQITKWQRAGNKLNKEQRREQVSARAAVRSLTRKPAILAQPEDFSGEAAEARYGLGRNKKTGRIEGLRQKQLATLARGTAEGQAADVDENRIAAAEAAVNANFERGDTAQLGNVRAEEARLEAALKKGREDKATVEQLKKDYFENVSQFDKQGKLLPSDVRAQHEKTAHAASAKILGLTLENHDPELEKYLDQLKGEVSKKLTDEQIEKLRLAPSAVSGLRDDIQARLTKNLSRRKSSWPERSESSRSRMARIDTGKLSAGEKQFQERLDKTPARQAAYLPAVGRRGPANATGRHVTGRIQTFGQSLELGPRDGFGFKPSLGSRRKTRRGRAAIGPVRVAAAARQSGPSQSTA